MVQGLFLIICLLKPLISLPFLASLCAWSRDTSVEVGGTSTSWDAETQQGHAQDLAGPSMFRVLQPCLLQAVVAIHQGQQGHVSHVSHVSVVIDALASASSSSSTLSNQSPPVLMRREGQPVAALEATRKLTYMALGATALLGYLGFLAFRASGTEASKEVQPEDRSLLGAWPIALQWMMLSMALSIFNKWIFIPEGANFPFPMTLSCCHMLATGLLLHLLRWAQPQLFPGLQSFTEERARAGASRWQLAKVVLLVGYGDVSAVLWGCLTKKNGDYTKKNWDFTKKSRD
eukprot:s2395_g12.t1